MDRPISKDTQNKRRTNKILIGILVIGGLACLSFFFKKALKTEISTSKFRIERIQKGAIEQVINATGIVLPDFEIQLNAPVSTSIQSIGKKTGSTVKKGASILRLNEEFIRLEYESKKDENAIQQNKIDRLFLEFDKNIAELEFDNQILAIQIDQKQAQIGDQTKLVQIGGATQEDLETAQLDLRISQIQKKKLESELTFRKKVLDKDKRELELDLFIQQKSMKQLQQKLSKTNILSPLDGVVTWVNENIGKQVQEGEAVAKVADLNSFRIEGICSDRYSRDISVGQVVKIKISKTFKKGTISSILPAVENNTVAFRVELDESDASIWRPNMNVELYLITKEAQGILKIKKGPGNSGGPVQQVFVVRGDQAVKESVEFGISDIDFIEIKSNEFQAGDQLIISDMKEYKYLDAINLKQ